MASIELDFITNNENTNTPKIDIPLLELYIKNRFSDEHRHTIKLSSGRVFFKENCYQWDEEKLMWLPLDKTKIILQIVLFAEELIYEVKQRFIGNNEIISKLNGLHKKIRTHNFKCNYLNHIIKDPLLIDSEFEQKINIVTDTFPIKGGLLLDLNTLKTRKRVISDLWTHELNFEYKKHNTSLAMEYLNKLFYNPIDYQIELSTMLTVLVKRGVPIHHGHGNNGKTTFLSIITDIFGNFKPILIESEIDTIPSISEHLFKKKRTLYESEEKIVWEKPFITSNREPSSADNKYIDLSNKSKSYYRKALYIFPDDISKMIMDKIKISRFPLIHYKACFSTGVDTPNPDKYLRDPLFKEKMSKEFCESLFCWFCEGLYKYFKNPDL